jgi:hypothetical protein
VSRAPDQAQSGRSRGPAAPRETRLRHGLQHIAATHVWAQSSGRTRAPRSVVRSMRKWPWRTTASCCWMSSPRASAMSSRSCANRSRREIADLVALAVRALWLQASTAVATSHRPDEGHFPTDSSEGELSRAMLSSRKKPLPGKSLELGERLARFASDVLPRSVEG